jgi:hypothetical protein
MEAKPENRRMRRVRGSKRVGPQVPPGYISIPEWGRQTGRGRVAAYAAAKRGEVEVEELGVMCIREDWRERNAARAAKEADERRQAAKQAEEDRRRRREEERNKERRQPPQPEGMD